MSFQHRRNLLRSTLARWTGAALVAAVVVPVGAHQAAAATTTVYASPSGGGTSCTSAQPCSLAGAQQLVRTLAPSMTGDITVDLRGGTYQLSSPLSLTPADSGTGGHTVLWQAYPGEQPVFSGGRKVSGWQTYDSGKGIYRAAVPTGTQ